MSDLNALDGFRADISDGDAARWTAVLVRLAFAVIVVGIIITIVAWTVGSAELGALLLSGTFAATTGVLVIRQAIFAERQ